MKVRSYTESKQKCNLFSCFPKWMGQYNNEAPLVNLLTLKIPFVKKVKRRRKKNENYCTWSLYFDFAGLMLVNKQLKSSSFLHEIQRHTIFSIPCSSFSSRSFFPIWESTNIAYNNSLLTHQQMTKGYIQKKSMLMELNGEQNVWRTCLIREKKGGI